MVTEYFDSIKGFDNGHLARFAFGHVTSQSYAVSLKTALNLIITKYGSAKKRSGLLYIANTFLGNDRIYTIGPYIVVSGDESSIIIYNNTFVREDTKVVITGNTATGYNENDIILSNGLEQHVSKNSADKFAPAAKVGSAQTTIELYDLGGSGAIGDGTYDKLYKFYPIKGVSIVQSGTLTGIEKVGTQYTLHTNKLVPKNSTNQVYGDCDYNMPCWGDFSNRQNPLNIYSFDNLKEVKNDHNFSHNSNIISHNSSPVFLPALDSMIDGSGIATYYQNRLVIAHDGYLFFSQVNQSHNFATSSGAQSPFDLKINDINEDVINVVAPFRQGLVVGTNAGIYVISSNSNSSYALTATEPKSVHKVTSMGVAKVEPIYFDGNMLLVSADKTSFIKISAYPSDDLGKTITATELRLQSDLPVQLGGVIKMKPLYWQTQYMIALTKNGSCLLCKLTDKNITLSEFYFQKDSAIKDFVVLKRNEQPDTVWFLIERFGKTSIEYIHPPIYERQYSSFFKNPADTFTTLAANEEFIVKYRALVHNLNIYSDYSYKGRFSGKTCVFTYNGGDTITASEPVFFPEMKDLAFLRVNDVTYEIIDVVDDKTVKINYSLSPEQQAFVTNWVAEGRLFSKIIPRMTRFIGHKYLVIGFSLEKIDKSLQRTNEPHHVESSHIIDLDQNQILNGFLKLPFYVDEFSIGLPYRTMAQFAPPLSGHMPNNKHTKTSIKLMTSFSGVFYSGKTLEEMTPDNSEMFPIKFTDIGINTFTYSFNNDDRDIHFLSDDATNMHLINYSEVTSV